jgi:hypothetical protein
LGGFESILKRMTPSNFNWLIHVMLFLHTVYVIDKQKAKVEDEEEGEDEEEDEDEDEEEEDDSSD